MTPVAFLLLARFSKTRSAESDRLHRELEAHAEDSDEGMDPRGGYGVAAE